MQYNVSYDIVSLLVLLIVTYKFYSQRQFQIFSNRLYGHLLLLGVLNLVLDLLGSYAVSPNNILPMYLAYIFNALYYITEISIPAAFAVYEMALISNKERVGHLSYVLLLSPLCVFLLVYIIGLPKGLIFTINENRVFTYGPISKITFFSLGFYMVLMIILLFINRKKYTKQEALAFKSLFFLISITTTIQYLYPSQLLSGTAIAVTFLIMYFTIQDPQSYLDYATGLFNDLALSRVIVSHYISKKPLYLAAIEFHDLHNIYALYGRKGGDGFLDYIGKYLSDFDRSWAFRGTDTRFICTFSHQKDLDAFVNDFVKIKENPVIIDDNELSINFSLVCILHAERYTTKQVSTVTNTIFDEHNIEEYKNKITYFSSFEMTEFLRLVDISNEVNEDIKTGDNFVIYYQPIYSIEKQRYVSVEALVRYQSLKFGLVQPFEFIPYLERNGLIYNLDEIVCRKVLEDIKNNRIDISIFETVHINLSAGHFASTSAIKRIFDIVDEYEVKHENITLEITETIASIESNVLVDCANLIRENGFGLALDDFGTGYSNISRFSNIPFTHIKIDRSITIGPDNILENIVVFLKYMNSTIVAEGVEDLEKVKQLEELGVNMIQGYYYSKPIPVDNLIKLINKE